jgi:hypothetical protein
MILTICLTVVWIRICFSVDPDPAFYVNAEPDPESQILDQTFPSLKAELFNEKYTFCWQLVLKHTVPTYVSRKAF